MKTLYATSLLHLIRETAVVTWLVGADGYVVDIPGWSALTGQSAAETEGAGWLSAIHPGDVERVRAAWMTAVAHVSHYNTDYRLRCADEVYRWFNARAVAVLDADGAVQHWIGVLLPIAGSNRFHQVHTAVATTTASLVDIGPAALRAARAMLGWSANRLADAAGVSLSTVRRLEDTAERDSSRNASIVKMIAALIREDIILHASTDGVVRGVSEPAARR